jgi:hypothetical protein
MFTLSFPYQELLNRRYREGDQDNFVTIDQREIANSEEVSLAEWVWCVFRESISS